MSDEYIDAPKNLFSTKYPEKGKKITDFDKHSKYLVKVTAADDLTKKLYEYSENFYESAHRITDFILSEEHPDIGKLDTFFFSIAFLYRHCIELILKAIAFQYISENTDRTIFVKNTRHNLFEILTQIKIESCFLPTSDELDWLEKYFADISVVDKESDSFRYPFHIVWVDDWWGSGEFVIKRVFNEQISVDLVKFANKFEAAYEILKKWYFKDASQCIEWKELEPVFIETGGYYYAQSVIGYKYHRDDFFPYTKAYLECGNFLKWFIKKEADRGNSECSNRLFLPMCYLYRNCVELSLKTIWFEETAENFQTKCKLMKAKKHKIKGLWEQIKSYVMDSVTSDDEEKYIEVIEDYCYQIHNIDSDANKFRYPMANNMQPYFSHNKRFDFMVVGDFFEELNNILDGIDGQLNAMNEYKAEMEAEYLSEMMSYQDYDY